MKKIEEFYEELDNYIDKLIKNKEDKKFHEEVSMEFMKKGFPTYVVQEVFSGERRLETLVKDQLIAMGKIWYKFIGKEIEDLEEYFGQNDVYNYEGRIFTNKKIDKMIFKTFIKTSDTEYDGKIDYKDLYDYYTASKLPYNTTTQRYPKFRLIGDKMVEVPNIDDTAVESIKECVLKGEFEDTQIVLNCREINAGEFTFKKLATLNDIEVGNLIIDCKLDVLDGMHRTLGIVMAASEYYIKNKKPIEGKIGIKLVCRDVKGAKRIINQSFKRSDTDKDFKKALEDNDYNKFVEKLANKTSCLKNNVAYKYEEALAMKKTTYHDLIVKLVKKYNYNVKDLGESLTKTTRLASVLNELMEIVDNKYNETQKQILKNANVFALYLAFANDKINKEFIDYKEYEEIIKTIIENEDILINDLKVNTKGCDINRLVDYFF
ncbi:MAG: hypothetical protein ACRC7N_11425 [Clostridium sp.]